MYIINSNFQRHIWSHCYLLYLPLFSGERVKPINRPISKIFNSFQVPPFFNDCRCTRSSKQGYKAFGLSDCNKLCKANAMCRPIGRRGIIEWITSSEKYFTGSKHTLRKERHLVIALCSKDQLDTWQVTDALKILLK